MRIAIANLKGGVGKSTTTMFLAEYLAAIRNLRVLVIDLDPQSNVSFMLLSSKGVEQAEKANKTLPHFLLGIQDGKNATVTAFVQTGASDLIELKDGQNKGLIDVLPSVPRMWFVEMKFTEYFYKDNKDPAKELHASIEKSLNELNSQYDVILIDCPPGFSSLTRAGLLLSDVIISPTIADEVSVRSLRDFVNIGLEDILGIKAKDRHHVVISKYTRTQTERRNIDLLKRNYDVFDRTIRQSVDMVRASYYLDPAGAGRRFNPKYGSVAGDVLALCNDIYRLVYKVR